MARIALQNGNGPSPNHLQLAGFDPNPEGLGRYRELSFTLANGAPLHMRLKAIDWGKRPHGEERWMLEGYRASFFDGYDYPDPESSVLRMKFDPFHKKDGEVELQLVSECHQAPLVPLLPLSPEVQVFWASCCSVCQDPATLVSPTTGEEELTTSKSLYEGDRDPSDPLLVGIIVEECVRISFDPSTSKEFKIEVAASREANLGDDSLLDVIPGVLKGTLPVAPTQECSSYYVLHAALDEMAAGSKEKALIEKALGTELVERLRTLQAGGKFAHRVPLALGEKIPPFLTVEE